MKWKMEIKQCTNFFANFFFSFSLFTINFFRLIHTVMKIYGFFCFFFCLHIKKLKFYATISSVFLFFFSASRTCILFGLRDNVCCVALCWLDFLSLPLWLIRLLFHWRSRVQWRHWWGDFGKCQGWARILSSCLLKTSVGVLLVFCLFFMAIKLIRCIFPTWNLTWNNILFTV